MKVGCVCLTFTLTGWWGLNLASSRQSQGLSLIDVDSQRGASSIEDLTQALWLWAHNSAELWAACWWWGGWIPSDVIQTWREAHQHVCAAWRLCRRSCAQQGHNHAQHLHSHVTHSHSGQMLLSSDEKGIKSEEVVCYVWFGLWIWWVWREGVFVGKRERERGECGVVHAVVGEQLRLLSLTGRVWYFIWKQPCAFKTHKRAQLDTCC